MDKAIRTKNLNWLQKTNPVLMTLAQAPISGEVVVQPSRKGAPTLAVGGVQIHSSYDPVGEAEKMAASTLESIPAGNAIILCGLGLGYFAEAILKKTSASLAIVEADPAILPAAVDQGVLATLGDSTLLVDARPVGVLEAVRAFAERAGGWSKVSFIQHPPSVKRFPNYYAELEALAKAQSAASSGPMRILVVTPMYGGSLPIARYCASAFKRLGHHVETLDNSIYDDARQQIESVSRDRRHKAMLGDLLMTLMSETISAKALDTSVDLVWLVAQSPMSAQVSAGLKKHQIPTAYWFVEEWQYREYWKDVATRFDYFFTIQDSGFLKALARLGVTRARKLDLAADPEVHRPLELDADELREFGSDLSHVGAGFRNRRQVFSGLTGYDFKLWGNDWDDPGLLKRHLQHDGARVSTSDMVKIFNASKINLNLHSSQFHDGVNPDGDYLNPRSFEIAASGGFQISDNRRDLPLLFKRDEEIAVFDNARDIAPMIEHYLNHPEERKQIAEAGYRRVLADHTYDLRMAEALSYISAFEPKRASTRHPNHIDNLIGEAEGDPELLALLEEMRGAGVVTLDQIVERIRKQDGELNKAEMIFLLMYEFRRWMAEKDLA